MKIKTYIAKYLLIFKEKLTKKKIIEFAVMAVLIITFFVFSALFAVKTSNVFPIVNALIMASSLIVFKGKYRLLALTFFISFSKCMTVLNTSVGSFMTWNILLFLIVILLERLFSKKPLDGVEKGFLLTYVIFAIYSFILALINLGEASMLKCFSVTSYFGIPLIMVLDKRAIKSSGKLLFAFLLSLLLSNVFAASFIYIFRGQTANFFAVYLPGEERYLNYMGLANFRFSGLHSDPNHNGFYCLVACALTVFYLFKNRRYYLILGSMALAIQIFGFLGQSKTYFLGLILLVCFAVFALLYKTKYFGISIAIILFLSATGLFIVSGSSSLINVVERILNTDTRVGFFEALTTQRLHIWENYLTHISDNPFKAIFGHGVWPDALFGRANHNVYIQILWDYGIVGTAFLLLYMGPFVVPTKKDKNYARSLVSILPLFVVLIYGISLHIIYDVIVYPCFFIYWAIRNEGLPKEQSYASVETVSKEGAATAL